MQVISRKELLFHFTHDYHPGQHVSLFGPTGRGKSTLCYALLGAVIRPDLQVISLHGKIWGRDPVIPVMADRYRLRIVASLPSMAQRRYDRGQHCNGYIIVPLTEPMAADVEKELLTREFGRAIHENYSSVDVTTITHINESHQVQKELELKEQCEAILMRGAPNAAEWNEAQRGRFLSYHTYSAPEHIFIFYDPDLDNRRRYSDLGCADPSDLESLVNGLRTRRVADGRTVSQCLYLRRSEGIFVVDSKV